MIGRSKGTTSRRALVRLGFAFAFAVVAAVSVALPAAAFTKSSSATSADLRTSSLSRLVPGTRNVLDSFWALDPTVVITGSGGPDLSVALTSDHEGGTVTAGADTVTYTATVSNVGDQANSGYTLTFDVPGSTSVASAPGCTGTGPVTCTSTTGLASGQSQDFTLTLNIGHDFANSAPNVGVKLSETASVSGQTPPDLSNSNDSATDSTVNVVGKADLAASVQADHSSDSSNPAVAGSDVTYTAKVTNNGPSDNTGYTLTLDVPSGTTFVSATGPGCSGTGPVVCTSTTALSPTNFDTYTLTVKIDASFADSAPTAGVTLSDASLASLSALTPTDQGADTGANSAGQDVLVVAKADLALTASASHTETPASSHPLAGASTEDYAVTVTNNNGPSDSVGGYTATASLPAGTTFDAANTDCTENAGTITCNRTQIGTLAPNGTDQFHIKLDLLASYGNSSATPDATPLTFTISIDTNSLTTPEPSGSTANNSDSPSITVYSEADLTTTKSQSTPGTLAANTIYANSNTAQNTVTFTVAASNGGVSDAHNVQINDALDSKFGSASYCSGASCTPSTTYTGSLPVGTGTLASGGSATFVVAVQADSTLGHSTNTNGFTGPGPYTATNTATTASSTPVHTSDLRTSTPAISTTIDTAPAPPTIVQPAVAGSASGAVMWSNAGEGTGGQPITSYTLKACLVSSPSSCVSLPVTNTTPNAKFNGQPVFSYVISGLSNTTSGGYQFSVIATNAVGDSDPANAGFAQPSTSAFTSVIPSTGAVNADTGFSGGAAGCTDPTLVTCKDIVGKYSFTDTNDIGAAYNLDAEPNNVLGSSVLRTLMSGTATMQCLDVTTLDPSATGGTVFPAGSGFGTVELSPDGCGPSNKVIHAIYPITTSSVPHLEYEQLDATITTTVRGAPCFAFSVDSTGTAQCTNPAFNKVGYIDPQTNKPTNFCPAEFNSYNAAHNLPLSNVGWTKAKPCAFVNYITASIPGFDICAHTQTTVSATTNGLCYGVKSRPVACTPGTGTCGAPVIIGSSVTLGITETSKLLAPAWCSKNLATVPCLLKILWLNNSTSSGNNDVQIQDYELGDLYKASGSG